MQFENTYLQYFTYFVSFSHKRYKTRNSPLCVYNKVLYIRKNWRSLMNLLDILLNLTKGRDAYKL